MNKKFKIALIGYGQWAKNYEKTIYQIENIKLDTVVKKSINITRNSSQKFKLIENFLDIYKEKSISGIIIATPPSSHYEIAISAINNRIPFIIEKPVTLSLKEYKLLLDLSEEAGILFMVGYTHLYSDAYKYMKLILKKSSGIKHIISQGYSYGPFREDVPVIWDWGSHDISMCIDLMGSEPNESLLIDNSENNIMDTRCMNSLKLKFPNEAFANCTFGNVSSNKLRQITVNCDEGNIKYDGISHTLTGTGFFKYYTEKFTYNNLRLPLYNLLTEFVNNVNNTQVTHNTMHLGYSVTKTISSLIDKYKLKEGE